MYSISFDTVGKFKQVGFSHSVDAFLSQVKPINRSSGGFCEPYAVVFQLAAVSGFTHIIVDVPFAVIQKL